MPHEARTLIESYSTVAREILHLAHQDLRRPEFLHRVSEVILDFSRCEGLEIFLLEAGRYHRSATNSRQPLENEYETVAPAAAVLELSDEVSTGDAKDLIALCCSVVSGRVVCTDPVFTRDDCFWTPAAETPLTLFEITQHKKRAFKLLPARTCQSIAMVPFDLETGNRGLLVLKDRSEGFFTGDKVELLKSVGHLLGMPIMHRRTQLALRERIKELTCLYGIARLAGPIDIPLHQVLTLAIELIPPAWLYPEITSARVDLDGCSFLSPNHKEGCDRMRSEITVSGRKRGFLEVSYAEKKPELDEGPFLQEERHLADAIASELAQIVDQYGAKNERKELREQLRHADRLATIGQLSAGVAHELNEPLGAVLGFAQLAQKDPGVPEPVRRDLEKIVAASLHAREIIKKLLLFARQSEPGENWVNLNLLVGDGLYFLESRCEKSGIELIRYLEEDLPEITADPGQIYQVLINLAVNAIQAMPQGGRLTILTRRKDDGVDLEVQDTGVGMSMELQKQIFMPFFTTKDIGEGTGLGLSVVDGIVSSHQGSIAIDSTKGLGTTFSVHLPLKQHARIQSEENEEHVHAARRMLDTRRR